MEFLNRYSSILIWIFVALVILFIVKKIIKKAIILAIIIGGLIVGGCIPYSTVNVAIDTATGGYNAITQKAALWSTGTIENEDGQEETKVLYILNTIPIMLDGESEIENIDDLLWGMIK